MNMSTFPTSNITYPQPCRRKQLHDPSLDCPVKALRTAGEQKVHDGTHHNIYDAGDPNARTTSEYWLNRTPHAGLEYVVRLELGKLLDTAEKVERLLDRLVGSCKLDWWLVPRAAQAARSRGVDPAAFEPWDRKKPEVVEMLIELRNQQRAWEEAEREVAEVLEQIVEMNPPGEVSFESPRGRPSVSRGGFESGSPSKLAGTATQESTV
ncbi:hypothetical protein QBC42DRAFT_248967 [Cladorrhinum samala]|uniref:Uncharacterized protein n=1 Tax=Cladorrhinum samala TaxID=585594 RepID=A0AAV9HWD9_9PEZI|nr:hypothetical protein QBC42DRAFT_248967 [Cladorrhinum samala]